MSPIRLGLLINVFALLMVMTGGVSAQTEAHCDLNVLGVIDTLLDVQASSDAGDSEAARAQLADALQQLGALEADCQAVPLPIPVLEAAYTSEDGSVQLQYPEGWFAVEEVIGRPFPHLNIYLSPDQQTAEQSLDNLTLDQSSETVAAVIVGTPFSILIELGLFNPDVPVDETVTFSEFAQYAYDQLEQNSGNASFEYQLTPLETANGDSTIGFSFAMQIVEAGMASIFLMQEEGSQSAALVMAYSPEGGQSLASLAEVIARSVEIDEAE